MDYSYTVEINAAPEKVWAILEDVDRWPEWTTSMTTVEALDKPLAVGSRVKIKQPKLPGATMTITALEENRSFSWRTKSLGLQTDAHHEVASSTPGTSVTLRFELSGPMAGIAGALMGSLIRRYVQTEGNGLKARAEGFYELLGTPTLDARHLQGRSSIQMTNWLLPNQRFESLADYLAHGGGQALPLLRERGAEWALNELDRSTLRGRGGAGFPTARKWRSLLAGGDLGDRYAVVNAAEGEPGTFKDRPLLRSNPYQVIEGLAIAATVLNAREAFIAVKRSFAPEIEALQRALPEMADAGLLCDAPVTLVAGPEEYLFGEEKALLEVIEGNDPMPRWLPPYLHGLFATTPQEGWSGTDRPNTDDVVGSNPTLVNNAETFANVPLILARGADWYRTIGTRETAGPLICTVVGDVRHPSYAEVEPGISLREVIDHVGGGVEPGHTVKAVLCGFSNPVLTEKELDTPVTYEDLAAAGGGLGSAGFIVYDDTRSMLSVARMVSRFLYVESCGQCRSCKFGCGEITRRLDKIADGEGEDRDFEVIGQRLLDVTSSTRCFLAEEEQRVISSLLRRFPEDFDAGALVETLPVPKIVDIHNGTATYDEAQLRKRPDWTYEPVPESGEPPPAGAGPVTSS